MLSVILFLDSCLKPVYTTLEICILELFDCNRCPLAVACYCKWTSFYHSFSCLLSGWQTFKETWSRVSKVQNGARGRLCRDNRNIGKACVLLLFCIEKFQLNNEHKYWCLFLFIKHLSCSKIVISTNYHLWLYSMICFKLLQIALVQWRTLGGGGRPWIMLDQSK